MAYADLLKDPRWQKKRLEIMERDEWTCQSCGDTEATLTVHHKSYRMTDGVFADIWDYGDNDLVTLCEKCHSEEEARLDKLKTGIYFNLRAVCQDAQALEDLVDYIERESRNKGGKRLKSFDFYNIFLCDEPTIRYELQNLALNTSFENTNIAHQVVDCCHFLLENIYKEDSND